MTVEEDMPVTRSGPKCVVALSIKTLVKMPTKHEVDSRTHVLRNSLAVARSIITMRAALEFSELNSPHPVATNSPHDSLVLR
jgi:hypothetical protein